MKITDLKSLSKYFKSQAETHSSIVLDNTVFSDEILNDIRIAFCLSSEADLTINDINPNDIPDPVGNNLTISAGKISVLNQSDLKIKLNFTLSASTIEATISILMGSTWKFSDSYKSLDIFPFPKLNISDAHFVYATEEQNDFEWPDDSKFHINLQQGLNFLSYAELSVFSVISTLLGDNITSKPYRFYGPISMVSGQALPVCELCAPISSGTFDVGIAPNILKLSSPSVVVRILESDEYNPVQYADLLVTAIYNDTLEVAISIPITGETIDLSTTPLPNRSSINALIESLPGGDGFNNYIPGELSKTFENVGLNNFTMVVNSDPKVTYLSLSISTVDQWTIISNILILDKLSLELSITDPIGLNWKRVYIEAQAKFYPKIFTGEFDFIVELQKQSSWEVGKIGGAYHGSVNLGDIVAGFLGNSDSVPVILRGIEFSNFGVIVSRESHGDPFSYTIYGNIEAAFPISSTELTSQLSISINKTSSSYVINLHGTIVIANENFNLALDLGTVGSKLSAEWYVLNDNYFGLKDIAKIFGNHEFVGLCEEIPTELDLNLKSASFTYDFTKKELLLTAVSQNYGNVFFIAAEIEIDSVKTWTYLFGIGMNEIDLTKLPIIGGDLKKIGNVGIENPVFIAISGKLPKANITDLNKLIADAGAKQKTNFPSIPEGQDLNKGIDFHMTFDFAGTSTPVSVNTAQSDTNGNKSLSETASQPAVVSGTSLQANGANTKTDKTQNGFWITIQKAAGPSYFNKVGINYKDGELIIILDVSLKLTALQIDLIGLSVGSELTKFDPKFDLAGVAVTYNSGPIEISGGFIKTLVNSITEYDGEALIKTSALNLSALGSYAKYQGNTSLFIFALLNNPPLGGPPAFFVTGVAAGFGYNRGLKIPSINEVSTFPLVSGFVPGQPSPFGGSSDPGKALEVLNEKDVVPVKIGENWLAAGVLFTSFEMLNSYALLSVEFGTKLEIALLGLSTASVPTGDPKPLMYAQLALDVRIIPDDGLIAVDAQLTDSSYLLDPACHLTGGFAFYVWYGSNAHAGDFVVTLGGYHPNFQPPDYYPKVPRLGFNWNVTSQLSIKGGMYFALTPTCLMAGGSLQALWQDGNLKAWFDIGADFLIAWKPYHYMADMYLSFGVSYKFKIDLLFTTITKTISVSLGANLSIWGPPFSGVAHIHLWIISFSVHFGAGSSQEPQPISWSDFETSFLPKAQQDQSQVAKSAALLATNSTVTQSTATISSVKVNSGLILNLKTKDPKSDFDWVVSAHGTHFITNTVIPAKDGSVTVFNEDNSAAECTMNFVNKDDFDKRCKDFGVGPVDVAHDSFNSAHNVSIRFQDGSLTQKTVVNYKAILADVPKSLWLKKDPDLTNETLIKDVLIGFEIWTDVVKPEVTPNVNVKELLTTDSPFDHQLTWQSDGTVEGPEQPDNPYKTLEESITKPSTRESILASLNSNGFAVYKDVSVTEMAKEASNVLLAPPIFNYEYWKS